MGKTTSKMEMPTEANKPPSDLNILLTNPGYSQIARNILLRLDHKSQLSCRLVSESWKAHIDQPFFWILKCDLKGQTKKLHDAWVYSFQDIEMGSDIEEKAIKCLMEWHRNLTKYYTQERLFGISPIHIAARYGHTDIVKFIVPKVQDFNSAYPFNKYTPIHYAARYGYLEMFRFLASKVDDFNAPKPNGWTPLHLAAWQGHSKIAKAIAIKIDHPNLAVSVPDGWTTIQLAERGGHAEIAQFITEILELKSFF